MTKNNELLAIHVFVDLKYVIKFTVYERCLCCKKMRGQINWLVCCASTILMIQQYHKDSIRPVWAHHDLFYVHISQCPLKLFEW